FEVQGPVESFQLNEDAQGSEWEYSDEQLSGHIRRDPVCDFLIILVNVKLEDNWYTRRLSDNRILFTFYELDQVLGFYGFPLKNLAQRVLYAYTLVYKRYGGRIPAGSERTNFTHDETRGCLFDMNASKVDVVHSLH